MWEACSRQRNSLHCLYLTVTGVLSPRWSSQLLRSLDGLFMPRCSCLAGVFISSPQRCRIAQSIDLLAIFNTCLAPLNPKDSHDQCRSCLAIEYLTQGLKDKACTNSSCMPLAEVTRLARSRGAVADLPPSEICSAIVQKLSVTGLLKMMTP